MEPVDFVAKIKSENNSIIEKKFEIKDDAINYLMNIITAKIITLDPSRIWRIINDVYNSFLMSIKYKSSDNTIYWIEEVERPIRYCYQVSCDKQVICVSKVFDDQLTCYNEMSIEASKYATFTYDQLFEYSPTEIVTGRTIHTVDDGYESSIRIDCKPNKITVQYEFPDDCGERKIDGHKYEIKMIELAEGGETK